LLTPASSFKLPTFSIANNSEIARLSAGNKFDPKYFGSSEKNMDMAQFCTSRR
jgi:hypothetical protein